MVYATQSGYYKAIEECSRSANCAPFIDFMLEEVLKTLKLSTSTPLSLTETERAIINCLREDAGISAKQIAELRSVPVRQLEKHCRIKEKGCFAARGGAQKR